MRKIIKIEKTDGTKVEFSAGFGGPAAERSAMLAREVSVERDNQTGQVVVTAIMGDGTKKTTLFERGEVRTVDEKDFAK